MGMRLVSLDEEGGHAVAGPVDHEAYENADSEPVDAASADEEAGPAFTLSLSGATLASDGRAHLLVFPTDKLVVAVAVCMELCKRVQSGIVAVVGNEPAGTLGEDEEPNDLQSWKEKL